MQGDENKAHKGCRKVSAQEDVFQPHLFPIYMSPGSRCPIVRVSRLEI